MVYTSKEELSKEKGNYIFLAGSIDNRYFGNWRKKVIEEIGDNNIILDPTNTNHDKLSDEEMKLHIQWELDALNMADIILLNFLPNATSPISLVELGMYITSGKLIVICPKEFYKNNYVTTLCKKYNVPIFLSMEKALYIIK